MYPLASSVPTLIEPLADTGPPTYSVVPPAAMLPATDQSAYCGIVSPGMPGPRAPTTSQLTVTAGAWPTAA